LSRPRAQRGPARAARDRAGRRDRARALRVAGERARARERDRAGRRAGGRREPGARGPARGDPARGPQRRAARGGASRAGRPRDRRGPLRDRPDPRGAGAHGRQPDPGGRAARPHPARPQAQDGPLRDRLGRGGLSPRRPLACRAVPGVRFGTSFGFDAKSRACSAAPGAAVPAGTKRRLGGQRAPERHFLAGTATYTARSPLGDGWHAVCDPPARRARGQPPEAPVIDRTSVRASVLVVDDERGPRESLRMILSPLYRVTAVANGSDALDALRTTPVDVVTLDLAMPGLR